LTEPSFNSESSSFYISNHPSSAPPSQNDRFHSVETSLVGIYVGRTELCTKGNGLRPKWEGFSSAVQKGPRKEPIYSNQKDRSFPDHLSALNVKICEYVPPFTIKLGAACLVKNEIRGEMRVRKKGVSMSGNTDYVSLHLSQNGKRTQTTPEFNLATTSFFLHFPFSFLLFF